MTIGQSPVSRLFSALCSPLYQLLVISQKATKYKKNNNAELRAVACLLLGLLPYCFGFTVCVSTAIFTLIIFGVSRQAQR